ncbi:DUF3994 domain-containing protein [Bacillus toyonensis]|uniref:DUF3994 domain-containing protein n=1 Tax=Bacillus toyonensis TaxID=155322 RepID=UPI0006AA572E|nr:DUF3994 domain-containing protein [Bacillus toyonensis]MCU5584340.1 DUF3994 domain-containing protein [Bacillus toyonensis]OKO50539.1 hypothetical protein ABH17_029200 [Bacillus toyonensis]
MNRSLKGIALTGFSVSFLLAGCTTETYGLTQSEYKLVDKEFKADKMVEDMKRLHYSDEEIERQLRGALATIKTEKDEKNKSEKKAEVKAESYSRESKPETNKSGYDNDVEGFPSDEVDNADIKMVKVSEKEYPYRLYEQFVNIQYEAKELEKRNNLLFTGDKVHITRVLDQIDTTKNDVNKFASLTPPSQFKDYYEHAILRGTKDIKGNLQKVEDAVKKYGDGTYSTAKMKEIVENGTKSIEEGIYMWLGLFEEIDEKYPDARQKALDKMKKDMKDSVNKTYIDDDSVPNPNDRIIELSSSGKELVGVWDFYKFEKVTFSIDFKKDGTMTMYESQDKEQQKKNYATGNWSYDGDKKQITLSLKEFIENGKKNEENDYEKNLPFTVKSFTGDSLRIADERDSVEKAKKHK